MSQASMDVSGAQAGSGFAAGVRSALGALATLFSGATAPASSGQPLAHQLWLDTATSTLKKRNGANTAWCRLMHADQAFVNAIDQNLVLETLNGALTTCSVTYDALSVEGTFLQAGSHTLSTGTTGAVNGTDSGAWATNTWYAVFVVCNEDGSLSGVLASTSATAPTMPSGYTRKRRVGYVRTQGTATNLWPHAQRNGDARWTSSWSDHKPFDTNPPSSMTDLSLASHAPPSARRVRLSIAFVSRNASYGGGTAGQFYAIQRKGVTNDIRWGIVSAANQNCLVHGDTECDANQAIQHMVTLGGSATTADFTATVAVLGWTDSVI